MRVRFEYVEKLENVKSLCNKSVFHKKKMQLLANPYKNCM